jgi:hypothetical protein
MKTTFDVREKIHGNSGMPTEKAIRDILALVPLVKVLSIKDNPDGFTVEVEHSTADEIDTALSKSGYQVSKEDWDIKTRMSR